MKVKKLKLFFEKNYKSKNPKEKHKKKKKSKKEENFIRKKLISFLIKFTTKTFKNIKIFSK